MSLDGMMLPLLGLLLVCAIGGVLSPLIVLKQRAYLSDTLAHLVFPGIIAGMLMAQTFHMEIWVCIMIGAFVTALIGTYLSEWFLNTLKVPPDSAAIVSLSAFFALGIFLLSLNKNVQINPESLLFGDIQTLKPGNVFILLIVFAFVLFIILFYQKHWNAWLTDPEFGKIAGFKVKMLDRFFPILIVVSVLSGFLAVGGLMISALMTLPAIFCQPKNVFSISTLVFSLSLGLAGFIISVFFGFPVGPILVLLGFLCVVVKSGVSYVR